MITEEIVFFLFFYLSFVFLYCTVLYCILHRQATWDKYCIPMTFLMQIRFFLSSSTLGSYYMEMVKSY